MNNLLVILIFVGVVIAIFVIPQKKKAEDTEQPRELENEEAINIDTPQKYSIIGALLSPAERSFFGVLTSVVGGEYSLFCKVRVADVLRPINTINNKEWYKYFNPIAAKHFDFVLCDVKTLEVIAAIELDDKSHNTKRAKLSDDVKNKAASEADLQLLRFPAKKQYSIETLRIELAYLLNNPALAKHPTERAYARPVNEVDTKPQREVKTQPEREVHSKKSNAASIDSVESNSDAKITNPLKPILPVSKRLSMKDLCNALGRRDSEVMALLIKKGYVEYLGNSYKITDYGTSAGGKLVKKDAFTGYFTWPADILSELQGVRKNLPFN